MHYFAPQLHPDQHPAHSLRASHYRKNRKSKHRQDQDHHHYHHHHHHQDASSSASDAHAHADADRSSLHSPPPNPHVHPSLAASDLAQLRVAGLLPDQEYRVPPPPFPHAPARPLKPYLGSAKIHKVLAAPPSRLFTVENTSSKRDHVASSAETSNLRRTHLNVLSTLMHTCLLQADYDRAGRAWGMIMRTQAPGGHPVDLRNHGRWAIAADILLRRKPRGASQSTQDQEGSAAPPDVDVFSEEGFELAREYYERLIVQHPTRKQAPHAVDQTHFYPAMFSLWIQEVYEKSKRARRRKEEETRPSPSRSMSLDSGGGHDKSTHQARSREDAIQVEERAQAMEIADRLDDLVKSPPFDKQASLLQLRGTIALWISDLIVGNTAATIVDEWDVYPISKATPAAEQIAKFNHCQRELHTAQNYLARVEENGGPGQHHTLLKIESRLKELQRQISLLHSGGDDDTNVSMEDDW